MKALSIRQPWAWAITFAGKDIENRNWATRYRGPVLIHAGKGMTAREYMDFVDELRLGAGFADAVQRAGGVPAEQNLSRGGIIGYAEIIDCVSDSSSPWFAGPFGFVLANPQPLPFQTYRGQLGFFEVTL